MDCCDSDGNDSPCVKDNELSTLRIVLMKFLVVPSSSKLMFLSNDQIDTMKVDELKQELLKQSLSKSDLKADLRKRLKQAIVDEIPIVDVLLEPSNATIGPQCKDPKLLDPSSAKYIDGNGIGNEKKVFKMSYATKLVRKNSLEKHYNPRHVYHHQK